MVGIVRHLTGLTPPLAAMLQMHQLATGGPQHRHRNLRA